MAQFTVRGYIAQAGKGRWNIRVQNAEEQRQFWERERITASRIWGGDNPPLVAVTAQRLVSQCQVGDEVEYVIETRDRFQGRGIQGVSIQIIKPHAEQAAE